MKKDHLITFSREDFISDIRDTLAKIRHRDFPVLDRDGKYCGMLSRRSLLNMDNKKIILVDHNEKGAGVDGIEEAEIWKLSTITDWAVWKRRCPYFSAISL